MMRLPQVPSRETWIASPVRRASLLLLLVAVCTATSCGVQIGIAVDPKADGNPPDAADTVFALVTRIAYRLGLHKEDRPRLRRFAGIQECFVREYDGHGGLLLCGKRKDAEVHFVLEETLTSRFSAQEDSVRLTLLDSLRDRYGTAAVRECKWRYERKPEESGCPLITAAALSR
jgi:hypothetical protein